MKYILMILPAAAIVCGIFTGRLPEVSAAVLESASSAVTLALTLCGAMALWSGLMKVAEEAGAVKLLSAVLSPAVGWLFRGLEKGGRAAQLICMNLSANILGLGNATTPLGIRAMEAIQEEEGGEVIGINVETLDGNEQNIETAKQILETKGASYRNIYFDSASDAGKFSLGIMAFPTTYVIDKNGNIVGELLLGGIDSEENLNTLLDTISKANQDN